MGNAYWLNDYSTLALKDSTDTDVVAGIQGVSIGVEYGVLERLYTADSIKTQAKKHGEVSVPIEIDYSEWDTAFAQEYMNDTGDAIDDTSDPPEFTLTGAFDDEGGNNQINVTVEGITFENPPIFDADRDEFVEWGLSGTGDDITDLTETTL